MALGVVVLLAIAGQGTAQAASTPTLMNQASASGLPAGSQIYDSATLGGGVSPTGSLTFSLFGPGNATCAGTPIFTTTTPVNGNGYYESSRYSTNAAGTYTWIAVYGGDANNLAAATPCATPSAQVTVGKRTPVLTTTRTWAPPSASASGVLSSGSGPAGPTGTMTYNLYGPNNMTCSGTPIVSSVRTVAWYLSYESAPFNPSALGTYQWVVLYSGDANNVARSTTCSDTSLGFTMTTPNPTTVSGSPTTVARGGTVTVNWSGIVSPTSTDWVGLYQVGTADGGAVVTWKYTTGAVTGSVALKFPWAATAGSYELRLMTNNTVQRLATSGPITLVW